MENGPNYNRHAIFNDCKNVIEEFRPLGWVGCVLAFLALGKVWLCVGVLCALPCAKNSVGSGRQNHGCLYMCRMSFRVTYNCLVEE